MPCWHVGPCGPGCDSYVVNPPPGQPIPMYPPVQPEDPRAVEVIGWMQKQIDALKAEKDAALLQIETLKKELEDTKGQRDHNFDLLNLARKGRGDALYELEEKNRLIEELKKFSLLFAEGMSAFTAGKPVSDAPSQEKNHLAHPWISGWLYSRYIVCEEKAIEKRKCANCDDTGILTVKGGLGRVACDKCERLNFCDHEWGQTHGEPLSREFCVKCFRIRG